MFTERQLVIKAINAMLKLQVGMDLACEMEDDTYADQQIEYLQDAKDELEELICTCRD